MKRFRNGNIESMRSQMSNLNVIQNINLAMRDAAMNNTIIHRQLNPPPPPSPSPPKWRMNERKNERTNRQTNRKGKSFSLISQTHSYTWHSFAQLERQLINITFAVTLSAIFYFLLDNSSLTLSLSLRVAAASVVIVLFSRSVFVLLN